MRKIIYVILLLCIFNIFYVDEVAYTHQPKISNSEKTFVKDPEISKAYYGKLEGEPHIYIINSDEDFNLYVNILVPDISGIDKDVSVMIMKNNEELHFLNGSEYQWRSFFEPFGGDSYWQGPEFDQKVTEGTYEIIVSSQDNHGKYSLAIGKIESFPVSEIINVLIVLPIIKQNFFNESPLTAYFNLSGVFLGFFVIIIGILTFFLIKKIRRFKN